MKWQKRGRKGTGHLTAQPLTATHGARPWGPAEAQEPPSVAFFKESGKSRGREQATRDDHAPHASSSVLDQATKSSVIAERCLQNMSPSSPPNPPLPWQHSERQQSPITYWRWVHTNILSILPLQARLTGAHGRAEDGGGEAHLFMGTIEEASGTQTLCKDVFWEDMETSGRRGGVGSVKRCLQP